MSFELTKAELSAARKVAQGAKRRYRDFVETEDVYQELVLWMLRREAKIQEWRELPAGNRALYRSLTHEARRYCESEKAAQIGYERDDNSIYTPGTLRLLLPLALHEEWELTDRVEVGERRVTEVPDIEITIGAGGSLKWAGADLLDDGRRVYRAGGRPHSTLVTMLIDVRRGMELVDENAEQVIRAAVDEDFDYVELAQIYSTEEEPLRAEAVRKRVDRALRKLADVMSEPQERDPFADIGRYSDAQTLRAQHEELAA